MDKVLVLCIAEVTRRYGGTASLTFTDSVMIKAEFGDQIMQEFEEHYRLLAFRDPRIVHWRMVTYLPHKPLKNWVGKPLKRGKVRG